MRDRHGLVPRMLATFAVALLLIGLASRPASATPTEALRMAWEDCPLSAAAVGNEVFACDNNAGSASLFCAFSVAHAIDQVIGLELVVDFQSAALVLPDWWQLGPPPDCRHDQLVASVDFTGTNGCEDSGFTGALVQDYLIGEPRGQGTQARIKAVAYVPSPQTIRVGTDTTYHAVRLVLSFDHTTGPSTCTGCVSSGCLVLNSILVRRVPGAPGGDFMVSTPGPASANWATWRGGAPALCTAVPVRPTTWGQLKSLYR